MNHPPPRHLGSGRVKRDPRTVAGRLLVAAVSLAGLSAAFGIGTTSAPRVVATAEVSPPSVSQAPASWARPVVPSIGAEGAWDPEAAESPSTVARVPIRPVTPTRTVQAPQEAHVAFAGASASATVTTTEPTPDPTVTAEATGATAEVTEVAASTASESAAVTSESTVTSEPSTTPTPTDVIDDLIEVVTGTEETP